MKNAEAEREKELKAAQQKVNSAKTKADAFSKKLKERQQEAESLVLELEELKREQAGYEQQILAVDEAMKTIQEQIDNMSTTVAENKVPLHPGPILSNVLDLIGWPGPGVDLIGWPGPGDWIVDMN
eukprot:XP_014042267.1 PREDICTED: structural maintenance of chromosomes protein 2-like isoform X2 [Salmo salar]